MKMATNKETYTKVTGDLVFSCYHIVANRSTVMLFNEANECGLEQIQYAD